MGGVRDRMGGECKSLALLINLEVEREFVYVDCYIVLYM